MRYYSAKTFYEAQEAYLKTQSEQAWETMWFCVLKCCTSNAVKIVKARQKAYNVGSGEFVEFCDEIAIQSAADIMARYKKPKGYKIQYIATVCRNQCFYRCDREGNNIIRQSLELFDTIDI